MKRVIGFSLAATFVLAFFSFGSSAFASESAQPVQKEANASSAQQQLATSASVSASSESGSSSTLAAGNAGTPSSSSSAAASSSSPSSSTSDQSVGTPQKTDTNDLQQTSQIAGSTSSGSESDSKSTSAAPAASTAATASESSTDDSPIIKTQILSEDSVYALRNASDAEKVVDVSGGSVNSGANVQLWDDDSTFAQLFRVLWLQDGWYNFINLKSGNYLDVAGADDADGANVQQYAGNGTNAQKWGLVLVGGFYQLVPFIAQDKRLDVAGGSMSNGANVQIWDSNSTNAQLFDIEQNDAISTAYAASKKSGFTPIDSNAVYEIVSALADDNTMTLDIPAASDADGTKVQLYTSNSSMAQKFQFDYFGNGLYRIIALCSGDVLDVTAGDTSNGARIQQYADNGTFAQAWYLESSGNYYVIHSAKSGKVIDVFDAQAVNGAIIQQYDFDGSLAQEFLLRKTQLIANGAYVIQTSYIAPMVIDVAGGSMSDGANVQIWRSNGTDAQKFTFIYDATADAYNIISVASGKYLDVAGAGQNSGTNVWQYAANGTTAQLWKVTFSNGAYSFKSMCDGLYLDISDTSPLAGANAQVWAGNNGASQRFNLKDESWTFYAGASTDAMDLIQYAEQYEGWPYVWGGRSPSDGFDCAGLVEWCANQVFGMDIDTTYTNAASLFSDYCDQISAADARAGDVVFFRGTYGDDVNYISHVLIYCGQGIAYGAGDPISYVLTTAITNIYDQVADIVYARLRY